MVSRVARDEVSAVNSLRTLTNLELRYAAEHPVSLCTRLHGSGRFRPRKSIFRTLDIVLDESDFHDSIRQIPGANVLQGCGKKFSLLQRDHIGNNDDHASVERFFAVEIKKIGAIVGDERILPLADDSHQLPIF